ncbi:MAG TPA: hypothetical protein VFS42_02815 [Burkholderiaceae bacterium]|nr:hypothetical protein [Burkholderiaceae bacterium]
MGAVFADRDFISDAATAQQWLARVSALDASLFIEHADAMLRDLRDRPRHQIQQLAIIETVRKPVIDAIHAQMRDCEFRAVPMLPAESASFMRAIEVARVMRDVYAPLAEDADLAACDPAALRASKERQRDPSSTDLLAILEAQTRPISLRGLAMQRVLATQSHVIVWSYRARMSVAQEDWDRLVRYGKLARAGQLTDAPVVDPTLAEYNAIARACLITSVLLMLAKPATMNALEFDVVYDLARRSAHKVKYRIEEGAEAVEPGPWPSFAATPFATVLLDTRGGLMDELRRLSAELEAGYSPDALGFDKRVSNASARDIVTRVTQAWRTPAQAVPAWRRPLGEKALAVPTLHQVLAAMTKRTYNPTLTQTRGVYQYRQRDDDRVIGHEDPVTAKIKNLFDDAETWQITGENAQGFMCTRRGGTPRLNLDQLVVMTTGNGFQRTAIFLGRVDWLRQEPQTEFDQRPLQELGVRLMLGSPVLIGLKLDSAAFEDAFMLRTAQHGATVSMVEMRDMNVDTSSLVVPLARCKEGQVTEMMVDGATERIRFGKVLYRGQDFDQVSFSLL